MGLQHRGIHPGVCRALPRRCGRSPLPAMQRVRTLSSALQDVVCSTWDASQPLLRLPFLILSVQPSLSAPLNMPSQHS